MTGLARSGAKPWRWYARLPTWGKLTLAAAIGAIAALGQAPWDQPLVMLVALSMAFLMARRGKRATHAAVTGWAFGVGYFALSLFWIIEPFQIDPERYGWMAPFALLSMAGGLALFWGLAFWVARLLSRRTWPLILTWTAAEMLRAYIFTGFPWASPPQALVNGMAGQSLAWVGPHGVMLWLMAAAWALSFPAVYRGRVVMRIGQGAVLFSCAALTLLPPHAEPAARSPRVIRLIQPNAPQDQKWDRDMVPVFFDRQLALTGAPPSAGLPAPDLVIWSETAIPWMLEDAAPALERITAAAGGVPVVLGVLRSAGGKLYNSLVLLDAQGLPVKTYDKHHIVPFGEYIPFGNLLGRFGIRGLADTDGQGFAPGPGARLIDLGALGQALPLICYEAVFAHDVNAAPTRPAFLMQLTNDAWFGEASGPQQHIAQARMRAIEQGLPLVRAANTGISAVIGPHGRVLRSLGLGRAGFIDAQLPIPLAPTLYSRTGDGPLAVLLILALGALMGRRRLGRLFRK